MTVLLDVAGLSAFYGRAQVLFGLSFQLRAGEVVGIAPAEMLRWNGQVAA